MSGPALPIGAEARAYFGFPGQPQRSIHVLLDGAVILVEGERIITRIDMKEAERLALDILCGDHRAATRPGGVLAIALAFITAGILRSPITLPFDVVPAASEPAPPVTTQESLFARATGG